MNRFIRMRKYNPSSNSGKFDVLFPQTITTNILRSNDHSVLESDLDNYDRHLENPVMHLNRALSEGTARALSVHLKDKVLVDNFALLLTLHIDLECEPTLSFNDSEPQEIISASGDRIPGGQIEGSVILLIWKKSLQKWVLLSSDNFTDITKIVLPVESEYVFEAPADNTTLITIPGFNKRSDKLQVNYGQTILRQGLDYEFHKVGNDTIELLGFGLDKGELLYCTITTFITTAKRGHYRYELKATDHVVTATEDGQTTFKLPAEADGAHSIVVNHNQTILRNNLDYQYNDKHTQIELTKYGLEKGDQLVFTITQFVEAPGEIVPNNWGATGNYRYSLNVIHTSYTATEDDVAVIAVPGFNYKKDHISVIQDNKLFIYDVDYTVDEIGNVVLLKKTLKTGEEIFFTILQGAMMDVPNFNVIRATGQDGQHILIDMSYSILCNWYVLLIKLKHDLLSAPTLKCIDGPAEPVCDCFGEPVRGGYKAGSYLWVVYDQDEHVWYSLSHSQIDIADLVPEVEVRSGIANFTGTPDHEKYYETVIPHNLGVEPSTITVEPCEPPVRLEDGTITEIGDIWSYADENNLYVGNSGLSTSKFRWSVSTQSRTNDLRAYIDQEIDRLQTEPGNLVIKLSTYTAEEDNVSVIRNISNFVAGVDQIIVNYNQTILRNGIDYTLHSKYNGLELNTFTLDKGDILQFTILKQVDRE